MATLIKNLINGRKVIFDSGRFDDWCVYVVEENGDKKAPYDNEYFSDLQNIAKNYPTDKVYDDFLSVYKLTDKYIRPVAIQEIDKVVTTYKEEHREIIEKWFSVIYGGMIAEENKERAILKKRIKHLGIYQVLKLGVRPWDAANYSKGKKWQELDIEMKNYGI